MHVRPLIPVKTLPHSKSRLRGVLTPDERQALTQRLLRRLLAVLQDVPGLGVPLVVSRDTAVAQIARSASAAVYCEQPTANLNQALHEARLYLRRHDPATTHLLILPSDLPVVTAADVAQVLASPTAVALVSDQRQTGTNALLFPLRHTALFALHYGPNSFQQHQQEAARCQLPYTIYTLPRLQFDLDTPQDWHMYQDQLSHASTL